MKSLILLFATAGLLIFWVSNITYGQDDLKIWNEFVEAVKDDQITPNRIRTYNNLPKDMLLQWGKMQVIGQLDPGDSDWSDDKYTDGRISITKKDIKETVEEAAEEGCVGAFLLGCRGDRWVKVKRFDMLEEFVSCVRKNGMVAGIGGHDKRVPMECEKAGIDVDFYFKTIHPESYWGAIDEEDKKPFVVDSFGPDDKDCMWELYPQETIDFMKNVKKPWIGYKVLAAGAVYPSEGFKFAFENGTDFVCAGMFDWQVRDNVETAIEILAAKEVKNRARKWA